MQCSNTIDAVGANDGEIGHAYLTIPENGGIPKPFLPVRLASIKGGTVPAVDLFDDLIDPGQ